MISCSPKEKVVKMPDLKITLGKVEARSVFKNDSMSIWGASLVKGEDSLYHLFYSRWPKNLGWAWVTHSEIAHAVSASPFGPFEFKDVSLAPRGAGFWDGLCTHNPNIHVFDGKYYLYYMGNTGDGINTCPPGGEKLNWVHRNNQRIGVAVADNPNGPWTRFDKPLIDVGADSLSWDALMTSNPAMTQGPDGKFLFVYKGVGKQRKMPNGGPVVHLVATSDNPSGPVVKYPDPVFVFEGEDFPAEDPFIWFQEGKYRAVVKRMKTVSGKRIFSLVQYDSLDGIDWKPSRYHHVSNLEFEWENGKIQKLNHLERPQTYIEHGKPIALLCAADTLDSNGVRQSFNVQIPISIEVEK